jgi:hypothetical protein
MTFAKLKAFKEVTGVLLTRPYSIAEQFGEARMNDH